MSCVFLDVAGDSSIADSPHSYAVLQVGGCVRWHGDAVAHSSAVRVADVGGGASSAGPAPAHAPVDEDSVGDAAVGGQDHLKGIGPGLESGWENK